MDLHELIKLRALTGGLRLSGRIAAGATRAGLHLSRQQGRGLEFDEVRAYQPGDDIRTIDWRVTARRGRPHTKLFREERERPLLIFADLHPGMFFGTKRQFKSVLVSRLAALAAWIAAGDGDRVGGVIASHERCVVLPPRARRSGVLRLLNELVRRQPDSPMDYGNSRLNEGLAKLSRVAHPGGMIIVLSDFVDLSADSERYLIDLSRKSRVQVGFIHDPLEAEPPDAGRYRFGLPRRQVVVDTSSIPVLDSWRRGFRNRLERLQDLSRKSRLTLIEASTAMEPKNFFRERAGVQGKARA